MFKRVGGVLLIEGLDTSKPAEYISESASPNNLNMMVERAELRKRPGHSVLGATAGERIMGGREFYREATAYVLRAGLTKVDLLSSGVWVNLAGAEASASPSSSASATPSDSPSSSPSGSASPSASPSAAWDGSDTNIISFATPLLAGKAILTMTNFINSIKKYDGTSFSDLGGAPPLAKFMLEYESYLVLAYVNDGSALRTMRVQWCDTADPETWTGGNSGAKDLISDEDITGISRFGNFIAVHKPSSIWLGYLVSTTAVMRFDMVATGRGTIANNTIRNLPTGEQIYLCKEGLALFNGNTSPLIQSPMLDDLRDGINPAYSHLAWGEVLPHLDEYWLGVAIGSQEVPETIFAYNYKTGKCHKHVIPNATCGWLYAIDSDETFDTDFEAWDTDTTRWDDITSDSLSKRLIIGQSDGNTIERNVLVHDDGDEAIDGFWESKDFTFEDPSVLVTWGASPERHGSLELWARGNAVTVSYSTDAGDTWTDIDDVSLEFTYPTDDAPIKLWFKAISTRIRFRFRNDTAGETFSIKQFMVHGKVRERR